MKLLPREEYIKSVPYADFKKERDSFVKHVCHRARTTDEFVALIVCNTVNEIDDIMNDIKNDYLDDVDLDYRSKKKVILPSGSSITCRVYSKNIKGMQTDYTLCALRDIDPIETYTRYILTRANDARVNDMFITEQGKTVTIIPDDIEPEFDDLVRDGRHTEV